MQRFKLKPFYFLFAGLTLMVAPSLAENPELECPGVGYEDTPFFITDSEAQKRIGDIVVNPLYSKNTELHGEVHAYDSVGHIVNISEDGEMAKVRLEHGIEMGAHIKNLLKVTQLENHDHSREIPGTCFPAEYQTCDSEFCTGSMVKVHKIDIDYTSDQSGIQEVQLDTLAYILGMNPDRHLFLVRTLHHDEVKTAWAHRDEISLAFNDLKRCHNGHCVGETVVLNETPETKALKLLNQPTLIGYSFDSSWLVEARQKCRFDEEQSPDGCVHELWIPEELLPSLHQD